MPSITETRRTAALLVLCVLATAVASSADAASLTQRKAVTRALPVAATTNRMATPIRTRLTASRAGTAGAPALPGARRSSVARGAHPRMQVIVRLREPSVAEAETAIAGSGVQQRLRVDGEQRGYLARHVAGGARVLGRVRNVANAVFLEVDAADIDSMSRDPAVLRVARVRDYRVDLSETVPYIGARAVQNLGITGRGVRVAVLDSGIDYLHANLGGAGSAAAFAANNPNIVEPGTFPTSKVVGGADFVGSSWPTGPLAPDADPLDDGAGGGHGTHVADIIGGGGGVAPGVALYAVKVCSSVATSCSGIALIQGMDFAVDPNGDGDTRDHVDIINMSLGADYGTAFDDDLSFAVDNASKVGVLTVASAGNGADRPFVTGTPAAAPSALSVAQTKLPSSTLDVLRITAPAAAVQSIGAVFQDYSGPFNSPIAGAVQYGDNAGGNRDGCAAFAPGSLANRIVLIDRGGCNFSTKISNVAVGGGRAALIGLVAAGDPFEGAFGGGTLFVPGFMINLDAANTIRANLSAGVSVSIDPAAAVSLARHMEGSSSRGPSMGSAIIKPEIGAPGASVSAIAGTGTDTDAFGGTSGAAPMVAGSAALLKQVYPRRSPAELKAMLTNTAETNLLNRPVLFGGGLAPITRIGNGEVRVDRALATSAVAFESRGRASLSFGFVDISTPRFIARREVTVRNFGRRDIEYRIRPTIRFANDAANGNVQLIAPNRIRVRAGDSERFEVALQVNGTTLPDWLLNSGEQGANADLLTVFELDGYVSLSDAADPRNNIHIAWQVLPRRAGDVQAPREIEPGESKTLRNAGVGSTTVEAYSLIGSSPNQPRGAAGEGDPRPDLRYLGFSTFPVSAGVCSDNASFIMAFAINTWERQTHSNSPALFELDLDTNQDGTLDYAVFNFDASLSPELDDGRNTVFAQNLATGDVTAFFFTDHDTQSGNTVLLICGEQIGMNATNFLQPIDVTALAVDNGFTGEVTDVLEGITLSPLGEQYLGVFEAGGAGATRLPPGGRDQLAVLDFGASTNNTETGLLLLNRGGAPARNEARAVRVE